MRRSFSWVALAYSSGAVVGIAAGYLAREQHPLLVAAIADLAATLVVFAFSYSLGNSSVYDPYWSIAPVGIAIYWTSTAQAARANLIRQTAVLALIGVWSARLTWNWARRWDGLQDEDWRYRNLRARHERGYWLVSFLGIHLMPTILVYLGCLSLYPALSDGARPMGVLDIAAILLTGGAIWIEAQADHELWRFQRGDQRRDKILNTGVWKLSRHPNYLGEIAFWWGLYLFCLATAPRYWWMIVGPISITCLFWWISIPLIERHLLRHRPQYAAEIENTPVLIPWFPKSTRARRKK